MKKFPTCFFINVSLQEQYFAKFSLPRFLYTFIVALIDSGIMINHPKNLTFSPLDLGLAWEVSSDVSSTPLKIGHDLYFFRDKFAVAVLGCSADISIFFGRAQLWIEQKTRCYRSEFGWMIRKPSSDSGSYWCGFYARRGGRHIPHLNIFQTKKIELQGDPAKLKMV